MSVTVAALQMASSWDRDENLATGERLVREAAAAGADLILPGETFALHMFMFGDWKPEYFELAEPIDGPTVTHMSALAAELGAGGGAQRR